MKLELIIRRVTCVAAFFAGSILAAQEPAPQSQPPASQSTANPAPQQKAGEANASPRIAPGSVIPVQLTKSIDAKKTKSGDEVTAKVTQDIKTTNGEVIVPKDTKVVGRVTAAQPRSKEQKESDVSIAFDHAVLKDGSEIKMPLSIQAIIAPANNNPNANNGGGYDQPSGTGGGSAMPAGAGAGRSGGMGGNTAPPRGTTSSSDNTPNDDSTAGPHAPITAKTQGVVGIADLKLTTAAPNSEQGSLLSSDKNNVKLESGTLMLLRVN